MNLVRTSFLQNNPIAIWTDYDLKLIYGRVFSTSRILINYDHFCRVRTVSYINNISYVHNINS